MLPHIHSESITKKKNKEYRIGRRRRRTYAVGTSQVQGYLDIHGGIAWR